MVIRSFYIALYHTSGHLKALIIFLQGMRSYFRNIRLICKVSRKSTRRNLHKSLENKGRTQPRYRGQCAVSIPPVTYPWNRDVLKKQRQLAPKSDCFAITLVKNVRALYSNKSCIYVITLNCIQ